MGMQDELLRISKVLDWKGGIWGPSCHSITLTLFRDASTKTLHPQQMKRELDGRACNIRL